MAQVAVRDYIGRIFKKVASAIGYDASTEGFIYNENDTKLKTHINGKDREIGTLDGDQILSEKTLTTPKIHDVSEDNTYDVVGSELTADRTVTLPLLLADDEVVFKEHITELKGKTIDSEFNTLTIDADEATVSELEVDNLKDGVLEIGEGNDGTELTADNTKIPSSKLVREFVEKVAGDQNEASEIDYGPAVGTDWDVEPSKVNTALDELAQRVKDASGSLQVDLVESATNLLLDGTVPTVDGQPTNGKRILITAQTLPKENGIYDAATGVAWTRVTDLNESAEFTKGKLIVVDTGDTKADTIWANKTTVATVDTDAVTIEQLDGDYVHSKGSVTESIDGTKTFTDKVNLNGDAGDSKETSIKSLIVGDPTVEVNTSGNDTSADGAGLGVATNGGTNDGSLVYTKDGGSVWKWKVRNSTTLDAVIADTSTVQDLSNKAIKDPTRTDVYSDTTLNLTTYLATLSFPADNGQVVFDTDKKRMFQIIDGALESLGGGGGALFEGTQVGHTLDVLDPIYHDSAEAVQKWKVAQADDGDTLAEYVVVAIDGDNFTAAKFGKFEITGHGLTVGEHYFLSPSAAGGLTSTEPTTDGEYSCPLLYVEDANNVHIEAYRPFESVAGDSGSGAAATAGSADTIHLVRSGSLAAPADLDVQGNAAEFDGSAGTVSGLSLSSTAADLLLSGSVIKYVPAADGSDDYFGFTKDIPQAFQGRELGFTFEFKTLNIANDDLRFCVKTSAGVSYYNMEAFEGSGSESKRFSVAAYIPAGDDSIEFGWQNTSATATVEFYVDNIEISSNPFVYKELVEQQSITLGDANGHGSVNNAIRRFTTTFNSVGDAILQDSGDSPSLGREFTALKRCLVTATYTDSISAGTMRIGISVNTATPTVSISGISKLHRKALVEDTTGSAIKTVTWSGILEKGDILRPHDNGAMDGTSGTSFSITAQAESEHVVTPSTVPKTYNSLDVSITGSSWSPTITRLVPYVDGAGTWRLKGNLTGTHSSTSLLTLTVGGVTFSPSAQQSFSASSGSTAITTYGFTGSGDSKLYVSSNTVHTTSYISFDVELESKPSWADPVSSQYLAAVPTRQIAYVKDVKAQGTNGGTFTAGTEATRDLNTLEGDTDFITINGSDTFTLQAGRYSIEADAPAYGVNVHKAYLWNITDSSRDIEGRSAYSLNPETESLARVVGDITITSPKVFEIRHRCGITKTTYGKGLGCNFPGASEVFTTVKIEKLI